MSDDQLRAVDKLKVVELKAQLGQLGLSTSGEFASQFRYGIEVRRKMCRSVRSSPN